MIDICLQKIVDVYNTQLIRTYALIDERFVKLALILKEWNKLNFKDKFKRLNSYSITLMLIAYMQHCNVLPRLQSDKLPPRYVRYQKFYKSNDADGYTEKIFGTNVAFKSDIE